MRSTSISLFGTLAMFSIIIFSGCKKEKAPEPQPATPTALYDTIYPGPYLPVYPGSFWVYKRIAIHNSDTTIDTVQQAASAAYVLHTFANAETNENSSAYVPYWNGLPLYEYITPTVVYSSPAHGNYGKYYPYKILSETIGDSSVSSITQYNLDYSKVMSAGLPYAAGSVTYPDVIKVNYYRRLNSYLLLQKTRHFARNVGMVSEEQFYYNGQDTNRVILELIDHHINN